MDYAQLPSDAQQWSIALSRQLRFYLRTWRFVGLLGFVLLVSVAFTVVTIVQGDSGGTAAGYLDAAIGNLSIFGIIIGAFIGGDAIAMDFGSGSGYFLLVLPVRRVVLLLGRYVAAFAVTVALLTVFYVLPVVGAVHFYGLSGLPWLGLLESFGIGLLFASAVLGTAFLFSSLFRSPAISMVVTILALFLGFLFADGIATSLNVEPWFSLLYAGIAVGEPLVPLLHHTSMTIPIGSRMVTEYSFNPSLWEGVVILVAYFAISLALSIIIYNLRESKG